MEQVTERVRPPAVAGVFYPADAVLLKATLDSFLERHPPRIQETPKAIIVPHAGYVYSGPVAASAYACLTPARGRIQRVVLLGPAHRVAFSGLAVPSVDYFETPLGLVPVDKAAVERIATLPQVRVLDEAHAFEHSLEVQLPFLQETLGEGFEIVPLVVGDTSPQEVAEVIDVLWGGSETLIVVSSDLSHYYDYDTARKLDTITSKAIEALDPTAIHFEQACGRTPVAGLLLMARRHGLQAETLDLRNSGDTAGDKSRVVGYGAYVFH